MNKCKCIKESSWFLIDDSFDENSKLNGGKFSFKPGHSYEYEETVDWFSKGFYIKHPDKENPTWFDEIRFFEHFEIL